VATVAAQAVFVILVGGDGFPGYRFVMPVYPLLCALAAIGLCATLHQVRRSPQLVIDGHFNARGRLVPRVEIGRALVRHRDWGRYRAVLEAPVYDGESLGLGHNRTNVLFVREGL